MKDTYKILIVDDEEDIRGMLHDFLTRSGHTCETAADGVEALGKTERSGFDAVIADIKMPGMDGITLTESLIKQYPDLPVMVMTGFTTEFNEMDAVRAGAREFISKPFTMKELSARFLKMMRDRHEIERLRELAHLDALTGLPNRKLFMDRLNHALETARRYRHTFALFFVDLDNFKDVNDRLGHDTGDLLLKETAARLMECVRGSDTVARMGGDEFTVILTKVSGHEGTEIAARRVLDAFEGRFDLNGHNFRVSVSIGISLYPSDGQDGEILLKKADMAMYRVKEQGRNGYRFSGEGTENADRIDAGERPAS